MSTDKPDTGEAIKLALASAETANDAAALAETTSKQLSTKADWVDRKLLPAGIGLLTGIVVCTGLSALIYYRTLGDLRTARDTHVEALHLFTQNVNRLNNTVELAHQMLEGQVEERAVITSSLETMGTQIQALEAQVVAINDLTNTTFGAGPDGFAAQLETLLQPQIGGFRDDVLAGLSDLHLALSQKLSTLANQRAALTPLKPEPKRVAQADPVKKPAPKVEKTKVTPTTRPKPRKTVQNTTVQNPFSYP